DVVINELAGITITLNDASLPSGFSGRGGHGGYDIVCFVAVYFDGGDIQRVHDLFDEINLAVEYIGGFIPASFVFGILFRPKSRRAQIEGNRNMGGLR